MNCCPEYEEILFLDIHGELDPVSHSRWQSHLKGCAVCRKEQARLQSLVVKVKETMASPPLTHAESQTMITAVRAGIIKPEKRKPWSGWLSQHWRVSPALATACVFAAIMSIWSLGTFDSFLNKERSSGKEYSQSIRAEEMEIIKNLDLLRQMDSVEKLVNTLDYPDDERSEPENDSKTS